MPADSRPSVHSLLARLILAGALGWPAGAGPEPALPPGWTGLDPDAGLGDRPASGPVLARWWEQLGDPRLDDLVREALAGSPDLQLARARLREARATRLQVRSSLAPTLAATAGAQNGQYGAGTGGVQNGQYGAGGVPGSLYDAGFDASWEADLFGAGRRGLEAATADVQASAASLVEVRVALLAEVAEAYVELRSAQRRGAIARANLASQTETVQITRWRCQAGLAPDTDLEQARTSQEQTRAALPDLEAAQASARHRLAVLLGRSPGALDPRLAEPAPLPRVPAAVAAGIPAGVLRQRPDLIAAERTLAAETARTRQKRAQRFPSLDLTASFGWQAYSLSALGGAGTLARTLGGTLAATLFDGGRLRSAVAIQDAVQEQALITYQQSVLTALEEVEDALAAYARSRDRVAALAAAAQAAASAAELAHQRYLAGLVDFRTVLDTERTRLGVEDDLAVAEAARLTHLIQLYKALGGGWEGAAGSAPPAQEGRT
jgi:NodT family efflux transporter outer membrane factor (OMF) lipoprotein